MRDFQIVGEMDVRTSGLDKSLDNAQGRVNSFATAGQVAFGSLIAAGVMRLAGAITDLGAQALQAYMSYERLSMSMNSLVARELVNSSGVEKMIATGTAQMHLSAAQREKLDELSAAYDKLGHQIGVAEERYASAAASGKSSADALALQQIKIDELRGEYEGLGAEIASLESIEGKTVTTMMKVTEGQLSMTEALAQATPKTEELLKWLQQLAIVSPFRNEDIAAAFQMNLTMGATIDQSKRMTTALIDFATATGQSGETVQRMARSLGQMRTAGKITGMEIRELAMAGLPVVAILAKSFDVTTAQMQDMLSKGAVPLEQGLEAITKAIETDFGGAAQRAGGSINGLVSSLGDLNDMSLRNVFGGVFKAAQPFLQKFVDTLVNPNTQAAFEQFGKNLGTNVGQLLTMFAQMGEQIASIWPYIQSVIQSFVDWWLGLFGSAQASIESVWLNVRGIITDVWQEIVVFVRDNGQTIWNDLQMIWARITNVIQTALAAVWSVINDVLANVRVFIATHGEDIRNFFAVAWSKIEGIIQTALDIINATIVPILAGIALFINEHGSTIQVILSTAWEGIKNGIDTVLGVIQDILSTVMAALRGDWEGAWNGIRAAAELIWNGIKQGWDIFWNGVSNVLGTFSKSIKSAWDGFWSGLKTEVERIWKEIETAWNNFWGGIQRSIEGAWNTLTGQAGKMNNALPSGASPTTAGEDNGTRRYATGGPVYRGVRSLYNENAFTRPEVFVPATNGYMLTKQDAQRALSSAAEPTRSGDTYSLVVNTTAAAEPIIEDFNLLRSFAGVS